MICKHTMQGKENGPRSQLESLYGEEASRAGRRWWALTCCLIDNQTVRADGRIGVELLGHDRMKIVSTAPNTPSLLPQDG